MTTNNLATEVVKNELVITRVFNAPRELVFKAFSESEALDQWWGPVGMEMCGSKLDFRPGGLYHYGMKAPDGKMMWGRFKFLEIIKPERIVFINSFADKEGDIIRAPFFSDFPLEVKNIITFTEHDGKTTLTLRGGPINATEKEQKAFYDMQSGMQQGFDGTFDQLEKYISKLNSKK
jgi:uncharacterized protein YndB with AHSA1/START domain